MEMVIACDGFYSGNRFHPYVLHFLFSLSRIHIRWFKTIMIVEAQLTQSKNYRICFFSRGRGKGHAVPDLAIMNVLRRLIPEIAVTWISYSSGASVLRNMGEQVIDLGFSDRNSYLGTMVAASEIIQRERPQLVLAHEEFAIPVAARIAGIPSVFITDFFLPEVTQWMESLKFCDEVIFIDEQANISEPYFLQGKVFYTGIFSRDLGQWDVSKKEARRRLGIAKNELYLLAYSGNWSEQVAPIADLVAGAFQTLTPQEKKLFWVAGNDAKMLESQFEHDENIIVRNRDPLFDLRMLACDIALTKGTRKVNLELQSLGKPSISISHGLNQIDDSRVSRIPTNTFLRAEDIDCVSLAHEIDALLASPFNFHPRKFEGLDRCVQRIAQHVYRTTGPTINEATIVTQ